MTGVVLYASLVGFGVVTGIAAGLLGVGGGTLMVPFLTLAVGMSQHGAQATSLLVVLPTAIVASVVLRRSDVGDLGAGLRIGLLGAAGGVLGALLALALPGGVLRIVFALFLAVLRSLQGPVFFPLRALAVVYTDLFRGIPTILVIAMLALGAPALGLSYVPTSVVFWGIVSLVLVYSAYVSEVYRAGIESIHPSQEAAARSLGLSHRQTLRRVILPQAVRRVIPPLLNDFIGLQKDTALVGTLGAIEAFQQASIDTNATFNYTAYLSAAVLFVAITIPLARFTDWLVARDRRRRDAGAGQ